MRAGPNIAVSRPSPTSSERYLSRVCRQSFLRLWSWPNLYRDQFWNGSREGKEVCDLLAVFGEHVFIFSDKDCEFPNTGDLARDWSRWHRRAVLGSARQIRGAERWILDHPDRLFVDRACTERFPLEMPARGDAVVHRIVVAHGSGTRCREELGGSGSLLLTSEVDERNLWPFMIGRIDNNDGYIHVMDDFTLDTVLRTVDTAADLAKYLQRKEDFILSKKLLIAAGEEDLLAYYLRDVDEAGQHHFRIPKRYTSLVLDEGFWEEYSKSPDRLAQIQADKVSYAWDELIEEFTSNVLASTQHYKTEATIADQETVLRLMAGEPRTARRMLSRSLFAVLERADHEMRSARVQVPSHPDAPYYVFLGLQRPDDVELEEYREVRREMLRAYCLACRLMYPEAEKIVGIATEPLSDTYRSEDFAYLDGTSWSPEYEAEARRLKEQLRLFEDARYIEFTEPEYPLARDRDLNKGRNRNQPCPCGSGRKFKKCHGGPTQSNRGIAVTPGS